MIKNLIHYIYAIAIAFLCMVIMGLYNKLRRLEIEVLGTRELKNVINNTDIKMNGLVKEMKEFRSSIENPVQEDNFSEQLEQMETGTQPPDLYSLEEEDGHGVLEEEDTFIEEPIIDLVPEEKQEENAYEI